MTQPVRENKTKILQTDAPEITESISAVIRSEQFCNLGPSMSTANKERTRKQNTNFGSFHLWRDGVKMCFSSSVESKCLFIDSSIKTTFSFILENNSLVSSDFSLKASKAIWFYPSLPLVNGPIVSQQLLLPRKGTWFLTAVPHCQLEWGRRGRNQRPASGHVGEWAQLEKNVLLFCYLEWL